MITRKLLTVATTLFLSLLAGIHLFAWVSQPAMSWFNGLRSTWSPWWLELAHALVALPAAAYVIFATVATSYVGTVAFFAFGIALLTATWLLESPSRRSHARFAVGAVGLLTLPVAFNYEAPIRPDEGHVVLWPTEPGTVLGITKRLQTDLGSPSCRYRLLGWSENNRLLYEESCDVHGVAAALGQAGERVMAFDPGTGHSDVLDPQSVDMRPAADVTAPRPPITGFTVRKLPGTHRSNPEHPDAPAIHASPEAISPNGRWLAAVVAVKYSPADVVVVSR